MTLVPFSVLMSASRITVLELEDGAAFWVITINTVAGNEPFASVTAQLVLDMYSAHFAFVLDPTTGGFAVIPTRLESSFVHGCWGPNV